MPTGVAWGAQLEAMLWTAPPWLALASPLPAALVARRTGRRLLPGLVAALGLAIAAGPSGELGAAPLPEQGYNVVLANTQAWSDDGPGELVWFLSATGADAVITVERRGDEIPGMVRVADNFTDAFKVSLQSAAFCREGLACEGAVSALVGAPGCGMPITTLRIEGALCVAGLHFPPPVSGCVAGRAIYLEAVTANLADGRISRDWGACRAGDPALIVGDMNAVPGSRIYRALRARGFGDALPRQGPRAATWPAGGGHPPLPLFRLDHALPGALSAGAAKLLPLPGSDHRGVWIGGIMTKR